MRWQSMAVQWGTVLVLLAIVAAIQIFKPEWMQTHVGSSSPGGQNQQGGAYDAIDGDSFRAGDVEIRLHGIDAPEYRQTCSGSEGTAHACGKMARDALSKLIRKKDVTCSTIDRDRYGRQVSVCRDGALEINREMVRLGWAVAYRRHASSYVSAEREAKAAKRGMWQWRFELPEDYRNRNRAVQGNVVGED
jgi:endonuclease YncB( thermonuclease family)